MERGQRVTLGTGLAELEMLPARAQKMLQKAGFQRVEDLLTHFPRRYEDRRRFDGFPHAETAEAVCLHGLIMDCGQRRFGYRRYAEIKVEEAGNGSLATPIYCRWFNMPWIAKTFAAGQEIVLYGRVKEKNSRLVIDHPDFEIIDIEPEGPSIHMNRMVPVYPLRDGLSQKTLREAMHEVLQWIDWGTIQDLLPESPAGDCPKAAAPSAASRRASALGGIHFPKDAEAVRIARQYLALEEFFSLQLNVLCRRQRITGRPGTAHAGRELMSRWKSGLPFSLTAAQERSLAEVAADMAAARPMNRLLQGDVGSGKTAVALAAALIAVDSGSQVAIMAPTQILAEQHFLNFRRQIEPFGVRVCLRTADRREDGGLPLFDGGLECPQIVIGTHALLFEEGFFQKLGLVVIDEQHKFGVAQRARLVRQGGAPDVLVMTATPIPRTLALTAYGDLDISVLDELPPGRGKVTTAVRAGIDMTQLVAFVRRQIEKGRQVFIVYPLVEESDRTEVKAATSEYESWQKRLPGVAVGLVHGRLKAEEKERVMTAFREGRLSALISTTVVEVGVDVPNANLMLVFNAERFGLAQLHQLRGRIGRDRHASYCLFICSDKNLESRQRLGILEETRDGFRIAEADLLQRGPGDLLGEQQSGLPGLRVGDLVSDAPLVYRARELAAAVLASIPCSNRRLTGTCGTSSSMTRCGRWGIDICKFATLVLT